MPVVTRPRPLSDLPKRRHRGRTQYMAWDKWWTPNKSRPVNSSDAKRNKTVGTSKRIVLAVHDGKASVLSYGKKGYGHNYSPEARRSYIKRHTAQHPDKVNDPLTPFWWSLNELWDKNSSIPAQKPSKRK